MSIKNTGNFSGGNVAAPDLGASVRAFSDVAHQIQQKEQNDIANARALEQLALQKQQFGLQQKQYDDAQAAKAAGSKYMTDMSKVLESGVVSQADQEKLAAISQDSRLSPEQKQQQINAMLPKMSDAYQKNDAAKLQLLQGVTASPMMDTRDKVALLGSVADPLEKRLDRDTKYGYDVKLQDSANEKAIALEGLRYKHDLEKIAKEKEAQKALWKDKSEFERDHTWMYHPTTGEKKYFKDLTTDERKSWIDNDTRKAFTEAGKIGIEREEKAAELQLKKDKAAKELEAANDKFVAEAGNPAAVGKQVSRMRSLGMPENKIREALTQATGGEWYDVGKSDYWSGKLSDYADAWEKTGKTKEAPKTGNESDKDGSKSDVKTDTEETPAVLFGKLSYNERQNLLEQKEADLRDIYDKMRTTATQSGDESLRPDYAKLKQEVAILKSLLIDPETIQAYQ